MSIVERTPSVGQVTLSVAARTDVGNKRAINEDSHLAAAPVFLVADGMGGHDAGEVASAAAIDRFAHFRGQASITALDVIAAVEDAQHVVARLSARHRRGAGSTLTGVALVEEESGPTWLVVNVGDSRVYRHHGGRLEQLTIDHSLVQELIDSGRLDPADAAEHAARNVITRALGAEDSPADYWMLPVVTGERLLVCSDGLTNEVPDALLAEVLATPDDADAVAARLVGLALTAGGRDNITVIVVDVVAGGIAAPQKPATASTEGEPNDTAEIPGRKGHLRGR